MGKQSDWEEMLAHLSRAFSKCSDPERVVPSFHEKREELRADLENPDISRDPMLASAVRQALLCSQMAGAFYVDFREVVSRFADREPRKVEERLLGWDLSKCRLEGDMDAIEAALVESDGGLWAEFESALERVRRDSYSGHLDLIGLNLGVFYKCLVFGRAVQLIEGMRAILRTQERGVFFNVSKQVLQGLATVGTPLGPVPSQRSLALTCDAQRQTLLEGQELIYRFNDFSNALTNWCYGVVAFGLLLEETDESDEVGVERALEQAFGQVGGVFRSIAKDAASERSE